MTIPNPGKAKVLKPTLWAFQPILGFHMDYWYENLV